MASRLTVLILLVRNVAATRGVEQRKHGVNVLLREKRRLRN